MTSFMGVSGRARVQPGLDATVADFNEMLTISSAPDIIAVYSMIT